MLISLSFLPIPLTYKPFSTLHLEISPVINILEWIMVLVSTLSDIGWYLLIICDIIVYFINHCKYSDRWKNEHDKMSASG